MFHCWFISWRIIFLFSLSDPLTPIKILFLWIHCEETSWWHFKQVPQWNLFRLNPWRFCWRICWKFHLAWCFEDGQPNILTESVRYEGWTYKRELLTWGFPLIMISVYWRKSKRSKITDSKINTFKTEAQIFISTLCHDILAKDTLTSYFAPFARYLNPINIAEIPDSCEK